MGDTTGSAAAPAARCRKFRRGSFTAFPILRTAARAIERGHAMRTDGEIERLSEMPADSIAAATTKKDLGTSRWQLCGKATSLSQAYGRGPWQVLAPLRHHEVIRLCPLTRVKRSCGGHCQMTESGPI